MTTYTTQFYQSYIANNKPNKDNPNNQNNDISVGFTTNTKFVLLQLRKRKFWSTYIQILTNFKKFIFKQFRTFHPSPICTFHRSRKTCTWLDEQFRTFHLSLHESVTKIIRRVLCRFTTVVIYVMFTYVEINTYFLNYIIFKFIETVLKYIFLFLFNETIPPPLYFKIHGTTVL